MSKKPNKPKQSSHSPAINSAYKPLAPQPKVNPLVKVQSAMFSGPLPTPDMLAQYNSIIPNGAERIMNMAEEQSVHRQSLEKTAIGGDSKRAYCGIFIGAFVVLCILGASVYCIMNGHDVAGATIATADIVGVITAFIYGTSSRRAERRQKRK